MHIYPFFDQNGKLWKMSSWKWENNIKTLNRLNDGHTQEISICYTLSNVNTPVIDTAFVNGADNKLYFFGEIITIFYESNKILLREIPKNKKTLSRREKQNFALKKEKHWYCGKMKSILIKTMLTF